MFSQRRQVDEISDVARSREYQPLSLRTKLEQSAKAAFRSCFESPGREITIGVQVGEDIMLAKLRPGVRKRKAAVWPLLSDKFYNPTQPSLLPSSSG